jgi:hypothetical protein
MLDLGLLGVQRRRGVASSLERTRKAQRGRDRSGIPVSGRAPFRRSVFRLKLDVVP